VLWGGGGAGYCFYFRMLICRLEPQTYLFTPINGLFNKLSVGYFVYVIASVDKMIGELGRM
jgi:hypothetical protein